MTDEQIVKALEYCSSSDLGMCKICPFYEQCENDEQLVKYTLDLIKRQKAEIEKLREKYDRAMFNLQAVLDERADHSEAIKEFAEKLKEYYPSIANGIDYTAEEVLKG